MTILQMTDTGVTFLSSYNNVGRARVYVTTLTSPPSLPLSRPWAELKVRRFSLFPISFKDIVVYNYLLCAAQREARGCQGPEDVIANRSAARGQSCRV